MVMGRFHGPRYVVVGGSADPDMWWWGVPQTQICGGGGFRGPRSVVVGGSAETNLAV